MYRFLRTADEWLIARNSSKAEWNVLNRVPLYGTCWRCFYLSVMKAVIAPDPAEKSPHDFPFNYRPQRTLLYSLISETRINVEPHTSIDIPGYTFVHFPSPTTVGGVGAYFSNFVNYTEIKTLKMQIRGCEDLWFDVRFPGQTEKYIIAVIYRHPWDNVDEFLHSFDEKLQTLNNNNRKVILMGDINIDLNSDSSSRTDYIHLIESNAFHSLITQPTRVTADSKTIIDHVLTNDNESTISSGVFLCKLADH